MTALLTAAQFASYSVQQPAGLTGGHLNASDQIRLGLSDGSSVLVFDSKTTALKCLAFMKERQQWMLSVTDDVAIVSIGATKLLIGEQSLTFQKLMASFSPIYQGGKTLYFSTWKQRCSEREGCPFLSKECESPTEAGYVNHLILSSEPLGGENVWTAMEPGELVSVDAFMKFARSAAPASVPGDTPIRTSACG